MQDDIAQVVRERERAKEALSLYFKREMDSVLEGLKHYKPEIKNMFEENKHLFETPEKKEQKEKASMMFKILEDMEATT